MATFTGIGGAFGGFFGAGDLEDAYASAVDVLREYQKKIDANTEQLQEKGQLSFDQAFKELVNPSMAPDVAELRKFLTTSIQSGLSPFAQLQFEQLNKAAEERSVATGNLRSGAIGYQRAQISRQIAADEFTRALNTLDTFQKQDLAQAGLFGNMALGYAQQGNVSLATGERNTEAIASGMVGKGFAEYQKLVSLGQGVGGLFDKAEEYGSFGALGGPKGNSFTG